MKKFLSFFVLLFSINACDDGNVGIQDISFDNITAGNCSDIVYKIKGNEALILKIKDNSSKFMSDQTETNKPISIPIDGTANSVTYRAYNSVPTAANFCSLPPAASPNVIEEWTATGGTIEITTTISRTTNATTNATTIDGYNHLILIKNVTFNKPNGTQFYETFSFGNYKTAFTALNLAFDQPIKKCTTSNNLTSQIGLVALMSFENITNLTENVATATGNPRVAVINSTNKLFYRTFVAIDPTTSNCATSFPASSNLIQEWTATSGTVEVTTRSNGASFIHEVRLKGVNFKKGNSSFYLGDDFKLGEIRS